MQKTVIVSGPTGAVGMALIQKCIKEKINVVALVRKNSKRKAQLGKYPLLRIVEADLDELDKIDLGIKAEAFFHLAWAGTYGEERNNKELQISNIENTLKAVRLAKKHGCTVFVGTGSQAEYGKKDCAIKPNDSTNPETAYGVAKLCACQMSRLLCEELGMKHIWARLFSVYGPYDRSETMVQSVLKKMIENKKVLLTPGEQQWDYIFSEDVAEILWRLSIQGKHGKIYCVGSGKVKPLREYVEDMKKCAQSKSPLVYGAIPYMDKQVMYLQADIEDLKKDIEYSPNSEFCDGITKTILWMRGLET